MVKSTKENACFKYLCKSKLVKKKTLVNLSEPAQLK